MKKSVLRVLACLMTAAMLFSMTAMAEEGPGAHESSGTGGGGGTPPGGFTGEMPEGGGNGGGGDAPDAPPGGNGGGGGGGSQSFYTGDAVTELESGDYADETFADSTNGSEVAVRLGPGVAASLARCTVTKTAGELGGDDSSFYGVNSGILAYSEDENNPAELTIEDSEITTSAQGANGVFAYGDATIHIKNSTVTTTQNGSGGIMVAGGGTLYAEDCTVTTEGGSSAAIRSDRGSGVMVIDGGTYISNGSIGTGSPAIYCVADITACNATMQANNAQAICFEGRNPAHIYNSYLEGNYTASDDDENCNVMVYQSMSGDSTEGTTFCTMVGGVLKANNESENGNAKMFYTTNTYCYISLSRVQMVYSDTMETFLLCACNTNQRGWGTEGANGSECVLYTKDQDMQGNLVYDTWSYLGVYMTEGSTLCGAILCREDNGDRGCDVYMDADSVWTVTGDSLVRNMHTGGGTIQDADGKTVSIVGADGTEYVSGDSEYTVTVSETYDEEDKSSEEQVYGVGTVADGEYTFDTDIDEYVDLDYVPTAPDGTVYEDAAWGDRIPEYFDDEPAEDSAMEEGSAAEEAPAVEETPAVSEAPAETPAVESAEEASAAEPETEAPAEEKSSSKAPIIGGIVGVAAVAVIAGVIVKKKKK